MSHPRRVKEFIPWSKAMVAGATVDKPTYHGGKTRRKRKINSRRRRKKHSRRQRAKKES